MEQVPTVRSRAGAEASGLQPIPKKRFPTHIAHSRQALGENAPLITHGRIHARSSVVNHMAHAWNVQAPAHVKRPTPTTVVTDRLRLSRNATVNCQTRILHPFKGIRIWQGHLNQLWQIVFATRESSRSTNKVEAIINIIRINVYKGWHVTQVCGCSSAFFVLRFGRLTTFWPSFAF